MCALTLDPAIDAAKDAAKDAGKDERLLCSAPMPGNDSHSFILRVWLEESAGDEIPAVWRGSLTHVLSNRRSFFDRLERLPDLIRPYVEAMLAESPSSEGE